MMNEQEFENKTEPAISSQLQSTKNWTVLMVNRLCSSGRLSQDTRQSSFSKRSNIEGEIELGIEPHNFDWLDSEKQREYLRGKFRKKL